MMFFTNTVPMVLYHQTSKDRLAKIRREGLKPHRPGDVWGVCDPAVWGVCDPAMTRGKRVVWLTADRHTWNHDRHRSKNVATWTGGCSRS